jgi:hypothetical protein
MQEIARLNNIHVDTERAECDICYRSYQTSKMAMFTNGQTWCEKCLNRGLEQAVQDPTYWPIMYHAIGENYRLIDMIHLIPADVYQRYQDKSFENTAKSDILFEHPMLRVHSSKRN